MADKQNCSFPIPTTLKDVQLCYLLLQDQKISAERNDGKKRSLS